MSTLDRIMREWLDVLAAGAFERWPELVHEDVVFRFPYAPPDMQSELRGAPEARAALLAMKSDKSLSWKDVKTWETSEPGMVVATLRAEAELVNGQGYRNDYVMLARFVEGKLIEHVEYFNPIPVQAAIQRAQRSGAERKK